MTEKGWLRSTNPRPMLEFLWSASTDRQLRLFACACARRVWESLADGRSRTAVEAAELFADGQADARELASACAAALDAQREAEERSPIDVMAALAARVATEAARPQAYLRLIPGVNDSPATTHAADGAASVAALLAGRAGKDANRARQAECRALANVMRDLFMGPFRAVRFLREWRTDTALVLARQMYESRDFGAMPILADALQDAGCDNEDILAHCRDPKQVHVRGCWVVDLVLGKE